MLPERSGEAFPECDGGQAGDQQAFIFAGGYGRGVGRGGFCRSVSGTPLGDS